MNPLDIIFLHSSAFRKMNTEAWDVFMTVSRDSGIVAAQCFEGPVRIVKCIMYLIFFAIIISCTFASKVSLIMMTTGAGDTRKVRSHSLTHSLTHPLTD